MRRLILCGICASVVGGLVFLAPVAAQASSPYFCTSSKAYELIVRRSHISDRAACRVLAKFVKSGVKVVHCSPTGASTLIVHSFDGYKLSKASVARGGGLEFSRGDRWFTTGGYSDWPIGCGI